MIINWEILHYDYWYVRYFCRVILTDLSLFLIGKICWTNLKFEFGFEYLFMILYISRYLHLSYFCFCMDLFCSFVGWNWWHVEHEILWKKVRLKKLSKDIELVVSLFWYIFYFSLLFGFIFINSCKYSFVYIYWVCTELNIEQTRNFV